MPLFELRLRSKGMMRDRMASFFAALEGRVDCTGRKPSEVAMVVASVTVVDVVEVSVIVVVSVSVSVSVLTIVLPFCQSPRIATEN